jgi:hypothetical protein
MQAFDPPTRKAIEALALMGEDEDEFRREDWWIWKEYRGKTISKSQKRRTRQRTLNPNVSKKALGDILDRAWWNRIWVVQEFASAQQVIFVRGSHSTTWKTIRANVHYQVDELTWGNHLYVANMLNVWKPDATQQRGCSGLLDYLSKFRYCQATDPRDTVFALLGLTTDLEGSG